LPGGFAPAAFYYNGSFPTNTTEVFIGYTFRLSSNWRDANNGTKHFFFGDTDNNHFCALDRVNYPNSGSGVASDMGLLFGPQQPSSFVCLSNITPIPRDTWVTIEFQVNYGTAGTANGTLRAWRNTSAALFAPYGYNDIYYNAGTTTESQLTTVQWASSGQSININRFQWEPTYGGGSSSPPESMFMDIGHVFCRVR
jgi:hypothetical protein